MPRWIATFAVALMALLCLATAAQAATAPAFQDDGPPTAQTQACEAVQILVNQQNSTTDIYWQYGTTTSYGSTSSAPPGPPVGGGGTQAHRGPRNTVGTTFDPASVTICGLTAGTTYHVQAVATNAGGTSFGPDQTFVAGAPVALTGSTSGMTLASSSPYTFNVNLLGQVGSAGLDTHYWFEYGPDTNYGSRIPAAPGADAGAPAGLLDVSQTVSGPPGVLHYRLVAQNGATANPTYGVDQTVTLGAAQAYADPPTPVSGGTEAFNGRVDASGLPTQYCFEYGTDLSYSSGCTPMTSVSQQSGQQQVSVTVAGLSVGTTYHYAVVATNQAGTVTSADQVTVAGQPSVSTGVPVQTSTSSETLAGQLTPGGIPTSYYFQYGQTSSYGSTTATRSAGSGDNPVSVSDTAPGLAAQTTYHFRLVATNSARTVYGNDVSFTLDTTFAVTNAATNVGSSGATLNGQTGAGGLPSTCWFAYGPTNQYSSATTAGNCGSDTVAMARQAVIGPLVQGQPVHYAVVVSNASGTFYGQDITFVPGSSTATTGSPTVTGDSSATLDGQVNPGGVDTTFSYQWGTTTAYGSILSAGSPANDAGVGSSPVDEPLALSGLAPSTTYHYRIVATNSLGSAYGMDATFTTPQAPTATTAPAAGAVFDGAVLNGSINPKGFATNYSFEYGTTASYGTTTAPQSAGGGNTPQAESIQILGLSPSTTYHYRIDASNGLDTVQGADQTFTTAATPVAPDVQSAQGTPTSDTAATVSAAVNAEGQPTTYSVNYGTTSAYGNTSSPQSAGTGSIPQNQSATLTGLNPGTTYHYSVVAVNGAGQTSTPDATFTTPTPPTANTGAPSNVAVTTATLNGTVNPNGVATHYYFEYGPDTAYGTVLPTQGPLSGSTPQFVTANLTGLTGASTYHYRLVATNGPDFSYGPDQSFTTQPPPQPPVVTTAPPTATDTTVTLNGSVNPSSQATTYYFNYGPTASYGSATTSQNMAAGTSSQPVSATLSGLAPNTTIHFQLVALNATGQTTGPDQTVTSLVPPAATTGTASPPTSSSAVLGGSVNPHGFATTYHFDYGTTTAYGATVPVPAQSAGAGTSPIAVSSQATGLAPNTTYHFRLVASNGVDVVQGADATFTTIAPPPPTAGTTGSSGVSSSSITASGLVNPMGYATTYYFDYGTDTSYGASTPSASAGSGSTVQTVSGTLSGLAPGTTYHFRLVSVSAGGTSYGGDQTATTSSVPAGDGSGGFGFGGPGSGPAGGSGGAPAAGPKPTIVVSGAPKETLNAAGLVILDPGLKVACPASWGPCQVTVPVTTVIPGKVVKAARHKKATRTPAATVTLGTGTLVVSPGQASEIQITLSHQAASLLRTLRSLPALVKVTLGGSSVSSTRAVTVLMPHPPKPKPKPKTKKH